MPEITDITRIRVVVARMMPSRVRKLRSLLPRSDWTAATTASQNDARALIFNPESPFWTSGSDSVYTRPPLQVQAYDFRFGHFFDGNADGANATPRRSACPLARAQ